MEFARPEIIRPPSEARCYFLPLTNGCSNNSCTFCNYYGCKLQIREIDEVKTEIDALSLYKTTRMCLPGISNLVYYLADEWDGKRIFLQDGDALVYPYEKLKNILEYANKVFPDLERIACYSTPQDLLRLDLEPLKALRALKLGIVYVGLESGDDQVLMDIGKRVSSAQIIDAGQKAKAAGIVLSISVILGLGGTERSVEHALHTAEVLNQLDPEFVGALTLRLAPDTPLYDSYRKGVFHPISPFQSLEELLTILQQLELTDCFFSSMHASNYFSVRGKLPAVKDRMMNQIRYVINAQDPGMLRPEYMRRR